MRHNFCTYCNFAMASCVRVTFSVKLSYHLSSIRSAASATSGEGRPLSFHAGARAKDDHGVLFPLNSLGCAAAAYFKVHYFNDVHKKEEENSMLSQGCRLRGPPDGLHSVGKLGREVVGRVALPVCVCGGGSGSRSAGVE